MISPQSLVDRLKAVAREKNIPFNACWKQFLLERFLARLAASTHSFKFIFKGGFLLSYLIKIGRETTDLDFLLTRMKAEEKELQKAFEQIITTHSADGFAFSFNSIELLKQPHMDYPGYRVILNTALANMKDKIQIDVGVGDTVDPLTLEIPLIKYRGKPFYENIISLLVYPVETIFSEKLETILSKGAGNSRMKDYHDLILLIRSEGILDRNKLREAVTNTFSHRGTTLKSIQFNNPALKAIQTLWAAHLRNIGDYAEELNLPKDISLIIEEVNKYVAAIHPVAELHISSNI
jgi:predicted nucleotidyltransferase component of viral defense system